MAGVPSYGTPDVLLCIENEKETLKTPKKEYGTEHQHRSPEHAPSALLRDFVRQRPPRPGPPRPHHHEGGIIIIYF